jgi:hypothetical protein
MSQDNTDEFVWLGRSIIGIIVLIVIIGVLGQYKIEKGEGAILTRWNGDKDAITQVGWKWMIPGAEGISKYSIVNNRLYFPQDLISLEQNFQGDKQTGSIGFDIKTADNKVVDTGGMVQFTITDLVQFGVMNTNPMEQLQETVNGEFFKILQSKSFSSDSIINDQGVVEGAIFKDLQNSGIQEQYGVKFTRVQLIRPTFTKDALTSLSTKQATIELSEGELIAAINKANITRTLADAQNYQSNLLKSYQPWILNYNAQIELYKVLSDTNRKGDTVYVLQTGGGGSGNGESTSSVVLPQPKNQ